jgi:hypothetical protein
MSGDMQLYQSTAGANVSATWNEQLWNPTVQSGYRCSCGQYVPNGNYHICQPQMINTYTYIQPLQWLQPESAMNIKTFKGSVDSLDDLPETAKHGDSYYVKDRDELAVREQYGWLLVDRK